MTASSEEAPLLERNPENRHRSQSRSKERSFSAVTLIIPISIICRLAILLPSTANFRITEIAACRLWYYLNDPKAIPPGGGIPEELCSRSEVDKLYAAITSILAVGAGLGTVVGCATAGYFGQRLGRKPVLLAVLAISMAAQTSVILSQILEGWLEFLFLFIWVVCQTIASPVSTIFVINLYIVDVSTAEERTAALSKIAGWATLGGAISLSLGGTITTQTHNIIVVYLVSLAILVLSCLYIIVVLPESFPASKRGELHTQHEEEASLVPQSWLQKAQSHLAIIIEPLQFLKPTYDPITGKYNRRLLYCAIHIFIVTLADGYAVLSMILYFTTRYKYTPAQTGYVLTTLNLTGVVVLTTIIPLVVRFLRPLYNRLPAEGAFNNNTASDTDTILEEPEEVVSEISDHLDVHITIGSWVIEALAYIAVGATTTMASQLISVVCIGFGAGRTPVFRSLVASSVDPLKQGEALAAIEVVSSLALILSPILMGSIVTSTITTLPQTIFYVHAAIILLGVLVLFFIRDSDRFQRPAIVIEEED